MRDGNITETLQHCAEEAACHVCRREDIQKEMGGLLCIAGLMAEAIETLNQKDKQIDWLKARCDEIVKHNAMLLKTIGQLAESKRLKIPVTERLPETGTMVLGWDEENSTEPCPNIFTWDGCHWNYWSTEILCETVTHWMPLLGWPEVQDG